MDNNLNDKTFQDVKQDEKNCESSAKETEITIMTTAVNDEDSTTQNSGKILKKSFPFNLSLSKMRANPDVPPRDPTESAPPPAKGFFRKLADAKDQSDGILQLICKIAVIIFGTIACTIALGFFAVIPIAMIVIGSIYLGSCPAQQYIPIFLVVGGVFGIFNTVSDLIIRSKKNVEFKERIKLITAIFRFFLFVWCITGCVWIYGIYVPEYEDETHPKHCHRTLYLFSFWLVTSPFIVVGLFLSCLMIITIFTICLTLCMGE